MFSGAAIAVTASANFVVKGAVDLRDSHVSIRSSEGAVGTYLVLFCTKDGCQVVGHGELNARLLLAVSRVA
jgi:hypothetical protein